MHLNKWIFIKQSPKSCKSWSGTCKGWRAVSGNSVNNNLWLNCNLSFAIIIHCRWRLKSAHSELKTTYSRQCLNRQYALIQHQKPDSGAKQKSSGPDLWQSTRATRGDKASWCHSPTATAGAQKQHLVILRSYSRLKRKNRNILGTGCQFSSRKGCYSLGSKTGITGNVINSLILSPALLTCAPHYCLKYFAESLTHSNPLDFQRAWTNT